MRYDLREEIYVHSVTKTAYRNIIELQDSKLGKRLYRETVELQDSKLGRKLYQDRRELQDGVLRKRLCRVSEDIVRYSIFQLFKRSPHIYISKRDIFLCTKERWIQEYGNHFFESTINQKMQLNFIQTFLERINQDLKTNSQKGLIRDLKATQTTNPVQMQKKEKKVLSDHTLWTIESGTREGLLDTGLDLVKKLSLGALNHSKKMSRFETYIYQDMVQCLMKKIIQLSFNQYAKGLNVSEKLFEKVCVSKLFTDQVLCMNFQHTPFQYLREITKQINIDPDFLIVKRDITHQFIDKNHSGRLDRKQFNFLVDHLRIFLVLQFFELQIDNFKQRFIKEREAIDQLSRVLQYIKGRQESTKEPQQQVERSIEKYFKINLRERRIKRNIAHGSINEKIWTPYHRFHCYESRLDEQRTFMNRDCSWEFFKQLDGKGLQRKIIRSMMLDFVEILLSRIQLQGSKHIQTDYGEYMEWFNSNDLKKEALSSLEGVEEDRRIEKEFMKYVKTAIKDISFTDLTKILIEDFSQILQAVSSNPLTKIVNLFQKVQINEFNKGQEMLKESRHYEAYKKLIEIKQNKDEVGLKLYKRFWFLSHTDPEDMMILHNADYKYEENPVAVDPFKENWDVYYWKEEPTTAIQKHPIPEGKELGTQEISVSIEIMVDVVNILLLMWAKFRRAFNGWMGSQAVIGITNTVYNWLQLETSISSMEEKSSKEDYMRCYRWIRWEAEQIALKAREDYELHGNYWVEQFILELFRYLEKHHFDTTPIYKGVEKMDEMRNIFEDPQEDLTIVMDKVKGIRKKIIEGGMLS